MKLSDRSVKFAYVFIVAALLFVFISVAVYAFLQGPPQSDTSVSGFGAAADTQLYEKVGLIFANTKCEQVLYPDYQLYDTFPVLKFSNYSMTPLPLPTDGKTAFSCRYDFDQGKYVHFNIYTYAADAKADPDRKTLLARVNQSLGKIHDSGRLGIVDYYLGTDKNDPTICRTTLLHPLNEFEYASIAYEGFLCDELADLNKEMVSIFGNYITTSLEYVYQTYANTSTADLLTKWGHADLVVDLNSYAEIN
jgi:hypothetical protein